MKYIYTGEKVDSTADFVHLKLGEDVEGGKETRIDLVQWRDPPPHSELPKPDKDMPSKKDPTSLGIARFSLATNDMWKAYNGIKGMIDGVNGQKPIPIKFPGVKVPTSLDKPNIKFTEDNCKEGVWIYPFYDPDGNIVQYLSGL
jgi:hypothetical protein